MALKIASIKSQEATSTSAVGTDTEDIRLNYNVHSFHLDVFAQKDEATAATVQNLVGDKITTIRLSTLNGNPETTIRTDDLFDAQTLIFGKHHYHSILTSTDDIPHAFGVQLPMSPFPDDPTRNFGLTANEGIQWIMDEAADVNQDFDNYVYDLTVEGLDTSDKPNSLGHIKYMQNIYTSGAVNSINDTTIGPANRLLGVYAFQTTSYDDLAAAAANDVTGIRELQITFSESIAARFKPSRSWSMKNVQTVATYAAAAAVINVLDDGRFWNDFGIQNDNASLGINIAGIGNNTKVKSVAGVASEATRIMPLVLV